MDKKMKLTLNIALIVIAVLSISLMTAKNNSNPNMLTGNAVSTLTFCEDSDGGLNYPLKGNVRTEKGKSKEDYCFLNSNTLKEFYCSGTDRKSEYHKCQDCKNGECVTTTSFYEPSCTDSDNGRNYEVSGNVREVLSSGETRNLYDVCTSQTALIEYYCVNSASQYETYNCPNGCINGACNTAISTPPPPPLPPPVPALA
jgi:hypothetical protein